VDPGDARARGADVILLLTDFGAAGPYVGELHLVLRRLAPEVPVVDLQHDLVPFRPDLAAWLLAARLGLARPGDVVLAVVDPGVGTDRAPLAVRLDGVWIVGPDNGLLEPALRRAGSVESFHIAWRPERLSASFHGRDLFAPVAARLARGERHDLVPGPVGRRPDWPDELAAIVYLDAYGNAITGLRAAALPEAARLAVAGRTLGRVHTFADAPPGGLFWYEGSAGLAEIAANGASAAALLGLAPGAVVAVLPPE
jgi:hypothetical protein